MGIPWRLTLATVFVAALVLPTGGVQAIEDVGTARWQVAPY